MILANSNKLDMISGNEQWRGGGEGGDHSQLNSTICSQPEARDVLAFV